MPDTEPALGRRGVVEVTSMLTNKPETRILYTRQVSHHSETVTKNPNAHEFDATDQWETRSQKSATDGLMAQVCFETAVSEGKR